MDRIIRSICKFSSVSVRIQSPSWKYEEVVGIEINA